MRGVVITLVALLGVSLADVSHIVPHNSGITETTSPSPPSPYSFQYAAGRYPGHIDRVHQEAGDDVGTIHGMYSYVDPKFKVRTVEYIADKTGFHPHLTNFEDTQTVPVDSEAVQLAKQKHQALYEHIANAHAQGVPANAPAESASVLRAKERHLRLYSKIADQHAAIAAEREAERLAFEATSVANDVEERQIY
ncbi:cuticle protein 16.8 [Neodiprion lecontei]|uniref:Cuticle protein 16.8 n=1 Tax=Neodiprion lecontei TaxID=441921 RepID=A0A6J0BI13_NEOLC|nr:cuticle protein 16.8 [Neodiprion lecontei]